MPSRITRRHARLAASALCAATMGIAGPSWAMPVAPDVVCDTFPDAPACAGGNTPICKTCHSLAEAEPALGAFGTTVKEGLSELVAPPFEDEDFEAHLGDVLLSLADEDADGDDVTNRDELEGGSNPGDPGSVPQTGECPDDVEDLAYSICVYDVAYAYRKVAIDVCGEQPSWEEMQELRALGAEEQRTALHEKLDACLATEFWRGPTGQLWAMAHRKIRPVYGLEGFAQFTFDYELFTWAQIDDHDVRDLLVAQYLVQRIEETDDEGVAHSVYEIVDARDDQPMQPERRAGMLTTAWNLFYNTMFTGLPRQTAAHAIRAHLGMDIALLEGLEDPVEGEPVDYDHAGVDAQACKGCHAVLDPAAYPFSRYNGLQGDEAASPYQYDPDRLEKYFVPLDEGFGEIPEAGHLFGVPVEDLLAWADVAADSEAFFQATTEDYWRLLVGSAPDPASSTFEQYNALWAGLAEDEAHSVRTMLHALIDTEAYGAP